MKLDLYNQKGEKKGTIDAAAEFFEIPFKRVLIHEALMRQEGNRRSGVVAHTKTKGEVRGGGKKPYAQKHTGRARQGSTRGPHMKGGGVTFGPRNVRNFKRMMPKKMRRLALFSALSEKARSNEVLVLDTYETASVKTKIFVDMVKALPVKQDALFILDSRNEMFEKSARNIANVKTMLVNYLNISDLRKYEKIIFLEKALDAMKKVFSS